MNILPENLFPVEIWDEIILYTDINTAFTLQNYRACRYFCNQAITEQWLRASPEVLEWLKIHYPHGYRPRVMERLMKKGENDSAKKLTDWLIESDRQHEGIPDSVLVWACIVGNDEMVKYFLDTLEYDHFDLHTVRNQVRNTKAWGIINDEIKSQTKRFADILGCKNCLFTNYYTIQFCSAHRA